MSFEHLQKLKVLDSCFLLYHRDSRLFDHKNHVSKLYDDSKREEILVNLVDFKNEEDLIDYILTFGRLYFLNKNFLN